MCPLLTVISAINNGYTDGLSSAVQTEEWLPWELCSWFGEKKCSLSLRKSLSLSLDSCAHCALSK